MCHLKKTPNLFTQVYWRALSQYGEILSSSVHYCFCILSSQHVDSSWPPLLYFSWIKTQVCCLSVLSASGTYYTWMGAQARIIRITGGSVEGKWFIARLIIANSPFTRITPDRRAWGLSLHYKRLNLPDSFSNAAHEKNSQNTLLWSCFDTPENANTCTKVHTSTITKHTPKKTAPTDTKKMETYRFLHKHEDNSWFTMLFISN